MQSYFLTVIAALSILALVSAKNTEENEDVISKEGGSVVPVWVASQNQPRVDVETRADANLKNETVTKRPQIGEIIGQGIQGIFQGIVRAPGDIAKGVQGIIDRLRRPSTASPSRNATATATPRPPIPSFPGAPSSR